MGAAAAGGGCDEASVVSLVSTDPGFGGRCLNERQQLCSSQGFKIPPMSLAAVMPLPTRTIMPGRICINKSPISGVCSTGVHFQFTKTMCLDGMNTLY